MLNGNLLAGGESFQQSWWWQQTPASLKGILMPHTGIQLGVYKHFKGDYCEVLEVVYDTRDEKPYVLYRALSDGRPGFVILMSSMM